MQKRTAQLRLLLVALCGLAFVSSVQAGVIFETTTTPTPGQPDNAVLSSWQFMGNIFVLNSPTHIDGIGTYADVTDGGTIFGAIISLPNLNSGTKPSGNPFDSTTLVSTTLQPGSTQAVVFAPVSVDLAAGDYAVVFGTGYYGATSTFGTFGISNGTALSLPAGENQISWGSYCSGGTVYCWTNESYFGPSPYFFEVTGTSTTPEPSTLALFGAGFISVLLGRRILGTSPLGKGSLPRS